MMNKCFSFIFFIVIGLLANPLFACSLSLSKTIVVITDQRTKSFIETLNCTDEIKKQVNQLFQQAKGKIIWSRYFDSKIVQIDPSSSTIYNFDDLLKEQLKLSKEEKLSQIQMPANIKILFSLPLISLLSNNRGFIMQYNDNNYTGSYKRLKRVHVYELQANHLLLNSTINSSDFILREKFVEDPHLYIYPPNIFSYYQSNKMLKQGDLLTPRDITSRVLIRPGDRVKVRLHYKNIHIDTQGVAKNIGRYQDMINIVNIQSQKDFLAQVIGPGEVLMGELK